jgi:hypothetical protein
MTEPVSRKSNLFRKSFLDLPRECRESIYHQLLMKDVPFGRPIETETPLEQSVHLGILRCCKQMHYEASPVLYGQNFLFTGSSISVFLHELAEGQLVETPETAADDDPSSEDGAELGEDVYCEDSCCADSASGYGATQNEDIIQEDDSDVDSSSDYASELDEYTSEGNYSDMEIDDDELSDLANDTPIESGDTIASESETESANSRTPNRPNDKLVLVYYNFCEYAMTISARYRYYVQYLTVVVDGPVSRNGLDSFEGVRNLISPLSRGYGYST